jgi:hypothetical protein
MITIKNSEAIVRRDITDDGWYVLGIKKGYNKYYINLTKQGEMRFKHTELSREVNGAGYYILKCGMEYCTFTKEQLKDMDYMIQCLKTFTN